MGLDSNPNSVGPTALKPHVLALRVYEILSCRCSSGCAYGLVTSDWTQKSLKIQHYLRPSFPNDTCNRILYTQRTNTAMIPTRFTPKKKQVHRNIA